MTTPAPSAPPTARRLACVIRTGQATSTDNHAPKYPPMSSACRSSAGPPASITTSPAAVPSSISLTPVARDQCHVSQGLDVVHQGGPPLYAAVMGARRGERRLTGPAVQVLHDRGLLTGHIAAGDPGDLDRHRVEPGTPALGHSRRQAVDQVMLLPVDAQVRLGRTDRVE